MPARPSRRTLALAGLAVLALTLAWIEYPPIFGLWENSIVYNSFRPDQGRPPLVLAIQEGGDSVGFHGIGYTLLTTARYVADIFGHSLGVIRLLPVLYGLIGLFLLFIVCERWFGWETAWLAAGLTATNPTYLVFQHALLPQALTIGLVFLCLERLQAFNAREGRRTAALLGAAFALTAMHYLLGRMCLLYVAALAAFDPAALQGPLNLRKLTSAPRLKLWGLALLCMVLILFICYPPNIFRLFDRHFIFSSLGEYSKNAHGTLSNVLHNLAVFPRFFLYGLTDQSHPSDLLVHLPYPLDSPLILALSAVGLITSLRRWREYGHFVMLSLSGVLIICVLLSGTQPATELINSTTLSSYRAFFFVPFLDLFAAVGGKLLYDRLSGTGQDRRLALSAVLIALLLMRTASHAAEARRFQTHIDGFHFDFSKPAIEKTWARGDLWFNVEERRELHLNQIYLLHLARHIARQAPCSGTGKTTELINVPADKFTPDHYRAGGGDIPYRGHPYFLPMYLTFYLRGMGVDAGYLFKREDRLNLKQKIVRGLEKNRAGRDALSFTDRFSRGRALVSWLREPDATGTERGDFGNYTLVRVGRRPPRCVLTTTRDEFLSAATHPGAHLALDLENER